MRMLVTGGRDFTNRVVVYEALDALRLDVTLVIHGACPVNKNSTDWIAQDWALYTQRIPCMAIPPAVDLRLNPGAGPARNATMLRMNPEILVAFPGGRGTGNMIALAQAAVQAGSKMNIWHVTKDGGRSLDPFCI